MIKNAFIKTFLLLLMMLTMSLPSFSKKQILESKWTTSSIKIDGLNDDWSGDALTFEKKVNVDYTFKNDADNLYVLFVFKERKFLSSIDYTGMTLWFNLEGKKKKNYGIKFLKKRIPADVFISFLEKQSGPIPEEKKKEIKSRPYYHLHNIEIINKKNEASSAISSSELKPPVFRAWETKNMSTYEFRIPLMRPADQAAGIGTEPGKNIKVGFEWGGFTKELREQRIKQQAASGIRAREGAADFATNEERREQTGGPSGSLASMRKGRSVKKYSFWVDVKLAQKEIK